MELLASDITEEHKDEFFIARNLQRLLKERNLNANQLATLLGIPSMTIGRLLSGQTADPRVSTLKSLTDYLGVTIDSLMVNHNTTTNLKPHFIPLLDWDVLQKINHIYELDLKNWKHWQPVPPQENGELSDHSFALTTRPSMYSRYPQGSVFIIDPKAIPEDGNIVLVKIINNNEVTLRELIIDPPEWQLQSVVQGSSTLRYSLAEHQIIGVSQLIMLYNKR